MDTCAELDRLEDREFITQIGVRVYQQFPASVRSQKQFYLATYLPIITCGDISLAAQAVAFPMRSTQAITRVDVAFTKEFGHFSKNTPQSAIDSRRNSFNTSNLRQLFSTGEVFDVYENCVL
jgi:hypothetical protein